MIWIVVTMDVGRPPIELSGIDQQTVECLSNSQSPKESSYVEPRWRFDQVSENLIKRGWVE